jgi:hypothetical protein
VAELCTHLRIGRLDIRLLCPIGAVADEHVYGAGGVNLAATLAVHTFGAAALVRRANGERVAVAADRRTVAGVTVEHATASEMVAGFGVRALEVRHLLELRAGDGHRGR